MSNTVTVTVTVQKTLIDRLSSFTQQSTKVLFSDHRSLAHGSRVVRVWFMLRSCLARLFIARSVVPSAFRLVVRAEVHGHSIHLVVFVVGACSSRKRLENCKRTYQYRARSRYHRSLSRCQPDAIRTKKKMSKSRSLSSESLIFAS